MIRSFATVLLHCFKIFVLAVYRMLLPWTLGIWSLFLDRQYVRYHASYIQISRT